MFGNITKTLMVAGLLGTLCAPAIAAPAQKPKPLPAKDPAIAATITQLEHAKKSLESSKGKDDAAHHRAKATNDIMQAMQELRQMEQGNHH